jgi:hypothetical protein
MSWVWEHGPSTATERLVLLALADFCDDDGTCFPSMRRIAEKACMTERGAQKILRRMAEDGVVAIETGGGRHGCNRYHVVMRNPELETVNTVHPNAVPPRTTAQKPRTRVQETLNHGSPEPSLTIIEPSKEEESARDALARVVGSELADAFIQSRKALKAPMTPGAGKLMAKKLAAMSDPTAAIEQSIENGWKGIFPPKAEVHPFPSRKQTYGERTDEAFAAAAALVAQRPFG